MFSIPDRYTTSVAAGQTLGFAPRSLLKRGVSYCWTTFSIGAEGRVPNLHVWSRITEWAVSPRIFAPHFMDSSD